MITYKNLKKLRKSLGVSKSVLSHNIKKPIAFIYKCENNMYKNPNQAMANKWVESLGHSIHITFSKEGVDDIKLQGFIDRAMLKALRINSKVHIIELSDKLGISLHSTRSYERGHTRSDPNYVFIKKWAKACGYSIKVEFKAHK